MITQQMRELLEAGLKDAAKDLFTIPEHHKTPHAAVLSATEGYAEAVKLDDADVVSKGHEALPEGKMAMGPIIFATANLAVEIYNRHGMEGVRELGHIMDHIGKIGHALELVAKAEKIEEEARFLAAKPVGRPS